MSAMTTVQGVIADELNAFEEASWFTSAYLVAMASTSPLTGRLSYIITPRYCMFGGTILITIGAFITGLAQSLPVFLLGRAISGAGAASALSVAIILIVQLTPPKTRGLYTGILNTGFTVGVAAGAIFAGALQPVLGWRVLFWGQGPLSLLAGIGLLMSIPSGLSADGTKRDENSTPILQGLAGIDYLGALLLTGSIVSLLYGLSTATISYIPVIVSIVIFPFFLYQEAYRHPDPIIPITVLKSRGALLACLATLGFMMSRWAVLFYTPIFATAVRGWAPAKAGSILIPTNGGFAVGGLLSGAMHIRRSGSWYKASLVVFAIFPVTLFFLALSCTATEPAWRIWIWTFLNGLCAGSALNYTLHHALYLVEPDVRFIVASLLATFRGFAGTFGSSIGGGVFVRVLRTALIRGFTENDIPVDDQLVRRLLGSPRAVQDLKGVTRAIAVDAYTKGIQTLFLTGVVLSVAMFFVQAGTGWRGPEDRVNDADSEDEVTD
jgi:predicted MFS family arabinose efflux permease